MRRIGPKRQKKRTTERASPASRSPVSNQEKCNGSANVGASVGATQIPCKSIVPVKGACTAATSVTSTIRTPRTTPQERIVPYQCHSPRMAPNSCVSNRLVAEKLGASAPETNTCHSKHNRPHKEDRVPIDHGVGPSGREGPVLSTPAGDQRPDNQAQPGDHQARLAATAASVELFHLVGRQIAFFKGQQCVGHGCLRLRVLVQFEGLSPAGLQRSSIKSQQHPAV